MFKYCAICVSKIFCRYHCRYQSDITCQHLLKYISTYKGDGMAQRIPLKLRKQKKEKSHFVLLKTFFPPKTKIADLTTYLMISGEDSGCSTTTASPCSH